MGEPIKITKLSIRDFQGIEALDVEPGDGGALVSGPNGAGKTSLLEAIEEAFRGKGHRTRLVRDGAEKGVVLVELSNGIAVKRTIKPDGTSTVTVKTGDATLNKPQSILDSLGDSMRFRPVEFITMPAKAQTQMLLGMIDMALTPEDVAALTPPWAGDLSSVLGGVHPLEALRALEKTYMDSRREVGQDAKRLEGIVAGYAERIPEGFDADAVRGTDLTEKVNEVAEARRHNEKFAAAESELARVYDARNALLEKITALQEQVDALTDKHDELARFRAHSAPIDTAALEDEIAGYQAGRDALAAFDERAKAAGELAQVNERYEAWGQYIEAVRSKPQELIAKCECPVDGMGIDEAGNVTIHGLPLDNLSDSERMALAVSVAAAAAGDLKVMLVNGIEAFDEARREAFLRQASASGFQLFASLVDGDADGLTVEPT